MNIAPGNGYAKYTDFGNRAFTLINASCEFHGGANESNLGIRYLKHDADNWTYSAAAFVPGGTVIASMDTDYGVNDEFDNGEYGSFKPAGLSVAIDGADSEGVVIEVSTAVNNSIHNIDCHVGVTF